jgi:hypothetical protein
MYSFQPAQAVRTGGSEQSRSFQRVTVNIRGRLMLSNYEEYDCVVTDMSPGDLCILCGGLPRLNERVIAYLDHIGRIEGRVLEFIKDGFVLSVNATGRKREKLAAQLTWIANKHELGLPEDRRHDRLTPRHSRTELLLEEDGRRFECNIMDLSLSGAAIDIEFRPPIDTPVQIGNIRGRIVRHFKEGVAVEFTARQTHESLRAFL